jgi:hypothetical protein
VPVHFLSPFPGTFQANEDLREKLSMRQTLKFCGAIVALSALLSSAEADVAITTFDNFQSDALYPGWAFPSTTIVSGPTSYSITATGYGSNYKYIQDDNRLGAGNTTVELAVTLSGPAAADGQLGPLVQLIDGDGTHYHYRWYGQTLGSHVLTRPVESPDYIQVAGGTPGLDLNNLFHMHMELDPGTFGSQGAYTVVWEDLSLTGFVPEPSSLVLLLGSAGLFTLRRSR